METYKDTYVKPNNFKTRFISDLTLTQRKEIQKYLDEGLQIKDISLRVGVTRGVIYHERMRMGSLDIKYDANVAHNDCTKKTKISELGQHKLSERHKVFLRKANSFLDLIQDLNSIKEIKDLVIKAKTTLSFIGADINRRRKPLNYTEIENIIKLFKEGKTYSQISIETGRSKSTLADVKKRFLHEDINEKKSKEENYERLKSKWID